MCNFDPQWFGAWKSQEGDKIVTFSNRSFVVHEVRSNGDKLEQVEYEHDWQEDADLEEAKFGYSRTLTTPSEIANRLESAITRNEANAPDFTVSNPTAARRAVAAISPGRYKVIWSYGGGDCAIWEYIIDGDRMLEVSDCKYHFNIRLFNRV